MIDSFVILRDSGIVSEASIAVSPDVPADLYQIASDIEGIEFTDSVKDALEDASAAVVCSGTATLETAMWGIPFIITYRTSALTYLLARILVRGVDSIGMANLVAGRRIAPELIQNEVNTDNIIRCIMPLLQDTQSRKNSIDGLDLVRKALGAGGSSRRAALYILEDTADDPA